MNRRNCLLLVGILTMSLASVATAQVSGTAPATVPLESLAQPPVTPPSPPAVQFAQFAQAASPFSPTGFDGPTPLATLIRYALAYNPEIQAARYRAQALGARVPQVKSLPDPQLLTSVFLEEIQTAAGPQDVALSLAQKFPWFGKLNLRSQVAYQDAMAAYARVTAVQLKVVERVKREYFDLYFQENAIVETRRLEQPLKDVIEIAKAKYETNVARAGLESVLQVQVELAKLDTTLVEFEQAKRETQARLAEVLHLPPQTQIEAELDLRRTNLAKTAETLVGMVEQCQPELEAWRREIARDRSSVDLAWREYWPDVTLGLTWYEMADRGISPVSNGRDAYSLAVGVNLPIYRKRLDAAVREARNKTSTSARRFAAARDQFEGEVQALYAQFQEQDRVLKILETQILPPAAQTLELSMESYRTGTQEFQQLIDAYRTLLDFRIDYHKRIALREQTIASLERAVGCAITSATPLTGVNPEGLPAPLPNPAP